MSGLRILSARVIDAPMFPRMVAAVEAERAPRDYRSSPECIRSNRNCPTTGAPVWPLQLRAAR